MSDSERQSHPDELPGASEVEKIDITVGAKIASHRDEPLAKAAGKASKLGDQGPLYAMSAGVLIIGLASRDRRLARCGLSLMASVGVADLSKRAAKAVIRRTRPHVLLDEHRYTSDAGGSPSKPEQSFPSGHTACSIAAARALSRDYPQVGVVAAVAAVGVGVSRVAKGAHWPLDVLGGAMIGLAAEVATAALLGLAPRCLRCRKTK